MTSTAPTAAVATAVAVMSMPMGARAHTVGLLGLGLALLFEQLLHGEQVGTSSCRHVQFRRSGRRRCGNVGSGGGGGILAG